MKKTLWNKMLECLGFANKTSGGGGGCDGRLMKRNLKLESLEARHLLSVAPWEVGQDTLMGFYSFENGTASDFGSFNGVSYGDAFTQYNETLNSSVLVLDGSGDYVSLGNPTAMNFSGQITLSAWVKADATDGIRNIVAHGYTENPNGEVFLRVANGNYEVGSWNGDDYRVQAAIPAGDVGNWVHLTGTYDGSAWRLYRNGMEIASEAAPVGAVHVEADWAIGARGDGSGRYFKGMLDNVAIHNWALTATQVQELSQRVSRGAVGIYDCSANDDGILYNSENDLNGTLQNGATFATDPDYGDYLSLHGGGYVSLGNPEMMNFSGEITIAAWVKMESTAGAQNIVAHGYTTYPEAEVCLRINDGQYQLGSWNGDNYFAIATIPAEDAGQWIHLAGVYDGTSWTLYRNGVEIASQTATVGAIPVNANWAIGATGDGSGRFFNGGIRGVGIYDKALSTQELEQLATQPAIAIPTAVEAWNCAPSDAGILYGVEGNVNGTLKNSAKFVTDEQFGNALCLDGTGGYVALGNPGILQITGEIALCAWIKPNSANGTQNIIAKGFTENPNGEIFLRIGDGQYQIGAWDGAEHMAGFTIPAGDVGNWVHLLGTYDGTSWNLYRNGTLVAATVDSTGAVSVNAPWTIGAHVASAVGASTYSTFSVASTTAATATVSRAFDGLITGVSVFNTTITPGQANALAQPENAPKPKAVDLKPVRVGGEAYAFCNTGNLSAGNSTPYTLSLDANSQDGITWEIDWGDKSGHETPSGTTTATHTYTTPGAKTIAVSAKHNGQDVQVSTKTIAVTVYETGNLVVNGDFETNPIPDGHAWWIFNNGQSIYDADGNVVSDNKLAGWTGLIEIQAGQYAELDADAHQENEEHPSLGECGKIATITSDKMQFIPGLSYTMTFWSQNRSKYAEDNMILATVPGTITHINDKPISEFGSNLTSGIVSQRAANLSDPYALAKLEGSSVTFSAGGTTYRYKDSAGDLQEDTGVTPFHIYSITFIPTADAGSVSFKDASTDDVIPSYGPFIDNVTIPARYVIADIDVDSNNDGEIDTYDDPIEMGVSGSSSTSGDANTIYTGAHGKVVKIGTTFTANLSYLPYTFFLREDGYDVRLTGGTDILRYSQPTFSQDSVSITATATGNTVLTYEIYHKATKTVVASDKVKITVIDPAISIDVTKEIIYEDVAGLQTSEITVKLNSPLPFPFTINYNLLSDATLNEDYTLTLPVGATLSDPSYHADALFYFSGKITFKAGETYKKFIITAKKDSVSDSGEYLILSIPQSLDYRLIDSDSSDSPGNNSAGDGSPESSSSGGTTTPTNISKKVTIYELFVDLDIDSDNNWYNQGECTEHIDAHYCEPQRTDFEESIESDSAYLGKLIMLGGDIGTAGSKNFTPIVIEVPAGYDVDVAEIVLSFDDYGYYAQSQGYGSIRIWTQDAATEGRYHIECGQAYRLSLFELTETSAGCTITLYVEGCVKNQNVDTLKDIREGGREYSSIFVRLYPEGEKSSGPSVFDKVNYVVAEPDSFITRLAHSQDLRAALAAHMVYKSNNDIPNNFCLQELSEDQLTSFLNDHEINLTYLPYFGVDPDNLENIDDLLRDYGFKVTVYKDNISFKYIVAFSGTDEGVDWLNNGMNGVGLDTPQYRVALEIGRILSRSSNRGSILFTGHSLGGGLASLASVASNGAIKAVTFNAAGLHPFSGWDYWDAYSNAKNFIKAYYVDWDILTFIQTTVPGTPEAVGKPIQLEYKFSDLYMYLPNLPFQHLAEMIECHSMDAVLYGFLNKYDAFE